MKWLNPPPGEYSHEEYLKMVDYYMNESSNFGDNSLAVPTDPFRAKFFGNKKVTVLETTVRLEELHEQRSEPD